MSEQQSVLPDAEEEISPRDVVGLATLASFNEGSFLQWQGDRSIPETAVDILANRTNHDHDELRDLLRRQRELIVTDAREVAEQFTGPILGDSLKRVFKVIGFEYADDFLWTVYQWKKTGDPEDFDGIIMFGRHYRAKECLNEIDAQLAKLKQQDERKAEATEADDIAIVEDALGRLKARREA